MPSSLTHQHRPPARRTSPRRCPKITRALTTRAEGAKAERPPARTTARRVVSKCALVGVWISLPALLLLCPTLQVLSNGAAALRALRSAAPRPSTGGVPSLRSSLRSPARWHRGGLPPPPPHSPYSVLPTRARLYRCASGLLLIRSLAAGYPPPPGRVQRRPVSALRPSGAGWGLPALASSTPLAPLRQRRGQTPTRPRCAAGGSPAIRVRVIVTPPVKAALAALGAARP
jgi:hypothetical protein